MLNQKPLIGALVLVAADNLATRIRAQKAAKLYVIAHEHMAEEIASQEAKIVYLCSLLNKHHVPADEFDLIVLNSLMQ